ncbi:MAG TPA: hypothetical protein VGM53_24890 [Streptosporangiaceae bacterium]|jgi:hypothetical protein
MFAIRETLSSKVRKVPLVRFTLPRFLLTAATVFFALAVGVGTAAASTTNFAARARGYGLSSSQVSTLQHEVKSFIARHGGKQTAINVVTFSRGRIVFAVPGQEYSRPVTSAATARPAITADCPNGAFCTYQDPNFKGKQEDYYACHTWFTNKYSGSWKNDQTTGYYAWLELDNTRLQKKWYAKTCKAWCENSYVGSDVVILKVHPC